MPLPTLKVPKYKLKLPSSGQEIEYRPFLVKEEKILLIAQESNNASEIIDSIRDLVKECTFGQVNISTLPMVDVEFLFLNIRAKSVGEKVSINLECQCCQKKNLIEFSLDSVDIKNLKKDSTKSQIKLNDSVGITLKYPEFQDFVTLSMSLGKESESESSQLMALVQASIESIWDQETIHYLKDTSQEDIRAFIDSMSHQNLAEVATWIQNLPKLSKTIEFDCTSCQKPNTKLFEGLNAFFA